MAEGRKRGAQPGNRNALKHGFYSSAFHAGRLAELEDYLREGLDDEIAMLRLSIRDLLEWKPQDDEPIPLDRAIAKLNALGSAAINVASLLKTKRIITGQQTDVGAALSQALMQLQEEMKK